MRDFDPKYPQGIDHDYNERQRAWEEVAWYEAQEQAAADREHDPQYDPRERGDEYDPNADAFDREIDARIERERERHADLERGHEGNEGCRLAGSLGHAYCIPETSPHPDIVALMGAVDKLEASVARLKRFLMVDGRGVEEWRA